MIDTLDVLLEKMKPFGPWVTKTVTTFGFVNVYEAVIHPAAGEETHPVHLFMHRLNGVKLAMSLFLEEEILIGARGRGVIVHEDCLREAINLLPPRPTEQECLLAMDTLHELYRLIPAREAKNAELGEGE